jgi:hypothetical protein
MHLSLYGFDVSCFPDQLQNYLFQLFLDDLILLLSHCLLI